MHFQILRYIVLPNVGYWKGRKLVPKKDLSFTKNILSTVTVTIKHKIKKRIFYLDRIIHREGDLPAIDSRNKREWYKKGRRHREGDLPAVKLSNGDEQWWKNGKLHRDGDLPAFIWKDIKKEWWKNGYCHREGDLPAIESPQIGNRWFKNGKFYYRRKNGEFCCISLMYISCKNKKFSYRTTK